MISTNNIAKNKIKNTVLPLILITFMIIFILFPDRYLKSSYKGIILWATCVLPSLLPFFFLTTLFTKTASLTKLTKLNKVTKFLFNQSGICIYTFIMSALSGYPVGSSIVSSLYTDKIIDSDEATRMSSLCSTSGPLFIVGSVGICMFNSKTYGFVILISHLLSAIFCGITFRFYGTKSKNNPCLLTKNKVDNTLYESMYSSILSILIVGGFICISYILTDILCDFNLLLILEKIFYFPLKLFGGDYNNVKGFCYGLIECTRGAEILKSSSNIPLSVSLFSSIVSFGGLSIFLQSIIYLKKAKVNTLIFTLSKVLQAIYAFIFSNIILYFL